MTRFDKIWNNEGSVMWIDGLGPLPVTLKVLLLPKISIISKIIHFCILIKPECFGSHVTTKHFVFERNFILANVKPFNCVLLRTTKICRGCYFFTFEIRRLCYKISQSKIYLEKGQDNILRIAEWKWKSSCKEMFVCCLHKITKLYSL